MWSFAFTATWHECPQSERLGSAVNLSGTSTTNGASVLFFGFPIRERLAVARNAGLVRLDHGRIGDDHLEHFVGPGGRDHRPVLVSPEVGERDSARRFQRVLVLRV